MDVGGGGGGGGGGSGPHSNNVLDLSSSTTRQDPRHSQHHEYLLRLTGKKLTLRCIAHIFVVGHHPPYVHLASMSHDKCSQAFSVCRHSSASVYYTERKPIKEQKKRRRHGNEAT